MGPNMALFFSNDDKTKVPLDVAAATLQVPILMYLEYKVRLPDHDVLRVQG